MWASSCGSPLCSPSSLLLDCRAQCSAETPLDGILFPRSARSSQLQIGDVTINLQSDLIPGLRHIAAITSGKSAPCEPTSTPHIRCCCDLPEWKKTV